MTQRAKGDTITARDRVLEPLGSPRDRDSRNQRGSREPGSRTSLESHTPASIGRVKTWNLAIVSGTRSSSGPFTKHNVLKAEPPTPNDCNGSKHGGHAGWEERCIQICILEDAAVWRVIGRLDNVSCDAGHRSCSRLVTNVTSRQIPELFNLHLKLHFLRPLSPQQRELANTSQRIPQDEIRHRSADLSKVGNVDDDLVTVQELVAILEESAGDGLFAFRSARVVERDAHSYGNCLEEFAAGDRRAEPVELECRG